MIWLAAAAQCKGRIIRIITHTTVESITEKRNNSISRQRIYLKAKVCSHSVPSLLHTNREARETVTATNKCYFLSFEEDLHGKPIYIDFSKDYVFFEDEYSVLAFYDFELWVENERFLPPNYREALSRTPTILERNLQTIGIGEELSNSRFLILPRLRRLRYVYFQKTMCGQGFFTPGGYFDTSRYNLQELFRIAAEKRGYRSVRIPEIVEIWPEVWSKFIRWRVILVSILCKDGYIMY